MTGKGSAIGQKSSANSVLGGHNMANTAQNKNIVLPSTNRTLVDQTLGTNGSELGVSCFNSSDTHKVLHFTLHFEDTISV